LRQIWIGTGVQRFKRIKLKAQLVTEPSGLPFRVSRGNIGPRGLRPEGCDACLKKQRAGGSSPVVHQSISETHRAAKAKNNPSHQDLVVLSMINLFSSLFLFSSLIICSLIPYRTDFSPVQVKDDTLSSQRLYIKGVFGIRLYGFAEFRKAGKQHRFPGFPLFIA
jgi:hypothetical protein